MLLFFLFFDICYYDLDDNSHYLPDTYNFLENFPECDYKDNMTKSNDYSYALSAIKAISHRICMKTQKMMILSTKYLLNCNILNDGIDYGILPHTYYFMEFNGVPDYDCFPWKSAFQTQYSYDSCHKCVNGSDMKLYKIKPKSMKRLESVEEMMKAIFFRGPITTTIASSFVFSQSLNGIYYYDHPSSTEIGDYSLEIIGWGKENEIYYWICSCNNQDFCSDGTIRIMMGINAGFIEDSSYEAEPDI